MDFARFTFSASDKAGIRFFFFSRCFLENTRRTKDNREPNRSKFARPDRPVDQTITLSISPRNSIARNLPPSGQATEKKQKEKKDRHLERMLVRREEALIVPPAFDEREAARFARGVSQCVHDVLVKKTGRQSDQ